MCGICGVYNYRDKEPVNGQVVKRMTTIMQHRGPDDEGYHLDGPVGLGFRRLSIIDLAGGAQPMSNEDDTVWVVFNGEIYNFLDLRPVLAAQGHRFKTRCDTEVILHAYEQYGEVGGLQQLNGMFGLSIWDKNRRQMVLARDPFGIKPLYYYDDGKRLIFGSDIKAILCHPSVERDLDLQGLDDYLTFRFIPSPRTLLKGISKVPPGYALSCNEGGVRSFRFHKVIPHIDRGKSEAYYVEGLQHHIRNAVERQMISDVPIGVMLSGGTDSSTIAAIMAQISDQPIKTFTVGFDTPGFRGNELIPARESADRVGAEHHQVVISAEEFFDFLPRFMWYSEEPTATPSALAYHYVCKLAREHVKVVLLGQGADEPFAGYGRHLGERYGLLYRSLPGPIRRWSIDAYIKRLRRQQQLKRMTGSLGIRDPLERLTCVYTIFDTDMKRHLYRTGLGPTSDRLPGLEAVERWQADVRHLDGLSQMLYVDARLSLPDWLLLYGDKMSMANSLEARVPFLDLELMAFAESIPPRFKIKGRTQKHILKRAVLKWVPESVVERRKIGFLTPMDAWLQSSLAQQVNDLLLDRDSGCRELFSGEYIEQLLERHRSQEEDYRDHLFVLILFEIWYQQFIAAQPVAHP